jgi:acyl-CoA synthetase (NDP forming)
MRGRYPSGPEYVNSLEGSAEAKRRAKVILQTVSGELRVQEACRLLGISEQRFQQLREDMLQAAVTRLEVRPAGRPATEAEAPELAALKEQVAALEDEVRAAELREEIALTLPDVVHGPAEPEKKSAGRPKRRARSRWWKKK